MNKTKAKRLPDSEIETILHQWGFIKEIETVLIHKWTKHK